MLAEAARPGLNINELLNADAFPHEVHQLQLLETHISWVILGGPFAYKIKKPVRFEFVDYSTLARRKHFCELELALNRRFAPELYLDVVSICERDGRIFIADESVDPEPAGTVIAYAVKMHQFSQDAIVAGRLRDPVLTAGAVEQFGRDIARFHQRIEAASPSLECVRIPQIQHDTDDNFNLLNQAFAGDPRRPELERLQQWSAGQLQQLRPEFASRLQDKRVRRCHGDMHLKNILLLDDRLIPFDGIEFNEALQWIDVCSELAFPIMDFFARGRADLAGRLLNAWLESADEYRGLSVMRFYLVYRSLVRAKVTWLNPANHPAGGTGSVGDETPLAGPWDKYLATASHFAFGLRPAMAITHGLSGSGKSTAARQWADQHGGIRIRSDVLRTRIHQDAPGSGKYSPAMTGRVYDELLRSARYAIDGGFPVVIDATFLRKNQRQLFKRLAHELGVDFHIIDCQAPVEQLRERIRNRRFDASEATVEVLERQIESREPLGKHELSLVTRFES